MFGSQNNTQANDDDTALTDDISASTDDSTAQAAAQDDNQAPFTPPPSASEPKKSLQTIDPYMPDADSAHAEPAQGFSSSPLPATTLDDSSAQDDNADEADNSSPADAPLIGAEEDITPAHDDPTFTPYAPPTDTDANETEDSPTETKEAEKLPAVDPSHLAGMKQQALDHLEPLVDHLDQSPEELFRTTMMMIQANDNHKLLEKALDAAKEIEDDKLRAQAMLDIINEINYFAQNAQNDQ